MLKQHKTQNTIKQNLTRLYYATGAAFTAGMFWAPDAHAGANDFSAVASNMQKSLQDLPGLLTAIAYLFGISLACLGILKIKDHTENPANTPLKDGAIRLGAGGALFALPIMFESMYNTLGAGDADVQQTLNRAEFAVH